MGVDKPEIYIGGALTDLKGRDRERALDLYEKAGKIFEGSGFSVYIPHEHTDPVKHADVLDTKVFKIDKGIISNARLMTAFLEWSSYGLGVEMGIVSDTDTDVLLIAPEGYKISRMVSGNPAVLRDDVIRYSSDAEALSKIEEFAGRYRGGRR